MQTKYLNHTRTTNELGYCACLRLALLLIRMLRPGKCINCNLKHIDLTALPSVWNRRAVTGSLAKTVMAFCMELSPLCLCFPINSWVKSQIIHILLMVYNAVVEKVK